jgi:hypothetical protein
MGTLEAMTPHLTFGNPEHVGFNKPAWAAFRIK